MVGELHPGRVGAPGGQQEALFAAAAAQLLDEQAATDDAEDALFGDERGDELPVPLRRQGERLHRLTAARDRLEAKKQAAQQAQDAKQAKWQARTDAGSKRPGRRPADTPPTARSQRSGQAPRANTTDPHSRGMRSKHTLVQGYNAQAAVTGDQVIAGMLLTQEPTDRGLLHDVLDATRTQLAEAGITTPLCTVLADAGYVSEDAFTRAEAAQLHLLAPVVSDERHVRGEDPGGTRDLSHLPATQRGQAKLRTVQGQQHYAQRGRTVEPVFGQIKDRQRLRQFFPKRHRQRPSGMVPACTVHNIRKLHKHHLTRA